MNKRIGIAIGLLLILTGLVMLLLPDLRSFLLNEHTRHTIQALNNPEPSSVVSVTEGTQSEPCIVPIQSDKESDPRYQQMADYNRELFRSHQADFTDERSYEDVPKGLEGLEELGYIEIPAMDVTLPLYCGASLKHMAQGAAVMAQTSMPIGGENTNCVIAGHRGYRGAPYFREIEKLREGDLVSVTNLWETLYYRVREISVIAPNDNEAVLIQEGEDLVTLLTCHPYQSHGKYRYLVICERCTEDSVQEALTEHTGETEKKEETIVASDGAVFESSQQEIQREELLRRIGAVVLLGLLVSMIFLVLKMEAQ